MLRRKIAWKKRAALGQRAAFELRPLFVCSTLTLLTESLHHRELAVRAMSRRCQLAVWPVLRSGDYVGDPGYSGVEVFGLLCRQGSGNYMP